MDLLAILNTFKTISLGEIGQASLQNRTDQKFIIPSTILPELVKNLKASHQVLIVNNQCNTKYTSLYLDTPDYNMYTMHHNGKEGRYKIRYRTYASSSLSFLEVKKKFKGITIKKRLAINEAAISTQFTKEQQHFIQDLLPVANITQLKPSIQIEYNRITLVNTQEKERITIDTNLSFSPPTLQQSKQWDNYAILEIKQAKKNTNAPLFKYAKKEGYRPSKMSKYCTGMYQIYPNLKYNRFKELWLPYKLLKNNHNGI